MTLMKRFEMFPTWSKFFSEFLDKDIGDYVNRHFSNTNTTLPFVNIKESNEGYLLEMAVPGMKKDDFKINLENKMLCIVSEKKSETEKNEENYSHKEFSYQSFSRSFSLPESVDEGKIEAKYDNGILIINISKKEEARPKPQRFINIS